MSDCEGKQDCSMSESEVRAHPIKYADAIFLKIYSKPCRKPVKHSQNRCKML